MKFLNFFLIIFSILFSFEKAMTFNLDVVEFFLENGIRIICIEKNTAPVLFFLIQYDCGSNCDLLFKSGVSHYLEHMAFASNKNVFSDFLEDIGASKNASTSFNKMDFYATIPSEYIEEVFKHEALRITNFDIDDDVFNAELGAILEERSMRTDNSPVGKNQESFLSNFFSKQQGGVPIIGWEHEIKKITKQDLYDFHQKWIVPNNAIVLIVGMFDIAQIKKLAKKYFGPIKRKDIPTKKSNKIKPNVYKEIEYKSNEIGSLSETEFFYYIPESYSKNFRKMTALNIAIKVLNMPDSFVQKIFKDITKTVNSIDFYCLYNIFQMDFVAINISCSSLNDNENAEKLWDSIKKRIIKKGISAQKLSIIKQKEIFSQAYRNDNIEKIGFHFSWLLSCNYQLQDILFTDDLIQTITIEECNDVLSEIFSSTAIGCSRFLPKGYDRD